MYKDNEGTYYNDEKGSNSKRMFCLFHFSHIHRIIVGNLVTSHTRQPNTLPE